MPPQEVVRQTNRLVAEALEPGDVVRNLPMWFDDARMELGSADIFVGYDIDPWDVHRYARMWVLVATAYADADQTKVALSLLENWEVVYEADRYRVMRGALRQPETVHWDALTDVANARVSRQRPDGDDTACTVWHRNGWHCGRPNEWVFVGPVLREMDNEYRNCVSAMPPEGGDAFEIVWDAVPLGQTLRLRAGNSLWGVRMPRGAAVHFQAWLDDEPLADQVFPIDQEGYPRFDLPTGDRAGQTGRLRVRLRADDNRDRYFCFRAQAVSPR